MELSLEVPISGGLNNEDEIQPRSKSESHQQLESVPRSVVDDIEESDSISFSSELSEKYRDQGIRSEFCREKDALLGREFLCSSESGNQCSDLSEDPADELHLNGVPSKIHAWQSLVVSNPRVDLYRSDCEFLDSRPEAGTRELKSINELLLNPSQEASCPSSSLQMEFIGNSLVPQINFPVFDLEIKEVGELVELSTDQMKILMNEVPPFVDMRYGVALMGMSGLIDMSIDRIDIKMADFGIMSMSYLFHSNAYKLFEEMTRRTTERLFMQWVIWLIAWPFEVPTSGPLIKTVALVEDSMQDFVVESHNQEEDHKGKTQDLHDKPSELNLEENYENFGEHDQRVLCSLKEDQSTAEFKPSMVILDPIVVVPEIEYEEMCELVEESMALIEIKWNDFKINSLVVDTSSAYKVFDILPRREIVLRKVVVDGKKSIGTDINLLAVVLPFDRDGIVIFDPGGFLALLASGPTLRSSGVETVIGNAIVDQKLLELT